MSSAWRKWVAGFYWIGVALAVACVAVVVAGHTERFALLERIDFPLSWTFAGMAGVAFLAGELCHTIASRPRREKRSSEIPSKMYGPPPSCKRKREGQGWSAQMYTALLE
jgi:hypothetical protein